ncbi:MAG: radical SAM protein [Candidatus Aenigmatarchaeota archaeon]
MKKSSSSLVQEKVDRILEWLNGEKALPFKIMAIPTNKCNLNCIYCQDTPLRNFGQFNFEDELKKEDWIKIIRKAVDFGVKEIWIDGGGEPLVRKDVTLAMVKEFKKRVKGESFCSITTNGTLFTLKDIKFLIEVGLDSLSISIDSYLPSVQDKLRGVKGTFGRCVNTLRVFKRLKRRMKKDKPALRINTVLTSKNCHTIYPMVRYFSQLGVDTITLNTLRIDEKNIARIKKERLELSGYEVTQFNAKLEELQEASEEFGIRIFVNDMGKIIKGKKTNPLIKKLPACLDPFYVMFIDPFGKVGTCTSAGIGLDELDLRKKELKEIWFSEIFNHVREKMLNGETTEKCKFCGLKDILLPEIINELKLR